MMMASITGFLVVLLVLVVLGMHSWKGKPALIPVLHGRLLLIAVILVLLLVLTDRFPFGPVGTVS